MKSEKYRNVKMKKNKIHLPNAIENKNEIFIFTR